MDFKEITKDIQNGNGYDVNPVDKFDYILEVAALLGINLYDVIMIDNTICEYQGWAEGFDKKEVVEQVFKSKYVPCNDDLNEISWDIIQDLGYETE